MNVDLSNTLTLRGENESQVVVDITKWSAEFVEYLISYGWGVRMQRCTAGAKDTQEFQEKEKKMLASMMAGELPHKGSGPTYNLDDRIATKFLTRMGQKGKIRDLDERWLSFARITVLNSIESPTDKAAVLKDKEQLTALAKEYFEAVKKSAMESAEWKKIKDELTAVKPPATKPTIKIVIGAK